ncbi:hypothetical protein NX059_012245 [Plenodomus lindquistii]|nr:hypothetical protein NX059_012245 [Plenodomus lindquistii]
MVCRKCEHNFCWVCPVPYSSDVQHTNDCIHGHTNAADDPRNWIPDDVNINEVNQIIEQNMVRLDI